MAQLTGKLGADFSAFYDAVTKADAYITDLSAGADRASARLNAMQDSLSGKAIVQQATLAAEAIQRIGGVSQLTEQELVKVGAVAQQAADKLRAMGQDVPAGIQKIADASKAVQTETSSLIGSLGQLAGVLGIAFSAEAIVGFVKETIAATAELHNLSIATGISGDGLQRLSYLGDEAGVNLESLTRGIEQMSAKLAGGDANATTAVALLGLSLDKLLAAGPEESFLQIAEAVGRVDDPMQKAAIASDIWGGRLSKQLLPLLGELRQKMLDVPKEAIISDANIAKAHEFEVGLDHLITNVKSYTASIFGALGSYSKWLESGTGVAGFLDLIHGKTAQATEDHKQLAPAVEGSAAATIHLTTTVKDKIAADKLAEEEAKQMADALVELDSAGQSWQETVEGIDGAVVEGIKAYLDAGVSQAALATAYGLTAAQVKAVSTALKDETVTLQLQQKAIDDSAVRWAQYAATKLAISGTTTQKLNAEIDVWVSKQIESHVKAKTDTADFYNWLGVQATASRQLLDQQRLLSDTNSRASFEKRKADAEDWYQFVISHASEFTNEDIALAVQRTQAATKEWATFGEVAVKGVKQAADAVHTLAGEWISAAEAKKRYEAGGSFTYDLTTRAGVEQYRQMNPGENVAYSDEQIIEFAKSGGTLQQLMSMGIITLKPYSNMGFTNSGALPQQLPGFATGGPTGGGGAAMLHANEYVVPEGGALIKGGNSGPLTINLVLPDGQALASVVINELTRGAMQERLWPARA